MAIFLALAFWGALWGIAGAFLSTPLTVMVMAICAEIPATRGIAVLLSSDGKPFSGEVLDGAPDLGAAHSAATAAS